MRKLKDLTQIATRIKDFRMLKKLTCDELAEKLGVSKVTVSNWENAKNSIDISIAIELSNMMNITIDEFYCENELEDAVSNNALC